jgi:hypothetical protein
VSGTAEPAEIVADLWRLAGADASALGYLKLSGRDPALPSSFRIGAAAQASIAAVGLAAAELRHRAGAPRQDVSVDMRHAATEFRSEQCLTIDGRAPAALGDPLFGAYRTGDGRFIRLHMNFPHHRENVLKLLACAPTRASVEAALKGWEAVAFETPPMNAAASSRRCGRRMNGRSIRKRTQSRRCPSCRSRKSAMRRRGRFREAQNHSRGFAPSI